MKYKFSLEEIPTIALVFLLIAIVLGIMATVVTEMQDASDGNTGWRTTATNFESNTSFTALNLTAVDFSTDRTSAEDWVTGSCTGVIIRNRTNQVDITSQFTVASCSATLDPFDNNVDNSIVNVNYTFDQYQYGSAYNNTQLGQESLSDLSGWQSVWVVVIAAAIVLGMIGMYLFFKPRG